MIKELLSGDYKGALATLTSTGGVVSLLAGGVGGFLLGGAPGLAVGVIGGGLLGGLLDSVIKGLTPGAGSYTLPSIPKPDTDLLNKGPDLTITLPGPDGKPVTTNGFTMSPNLNRIKKLEFEVSKLIPQTDEAERLKDPSHRKNAFEVLEKQYTGAFKLDVNFNEYAKLATEYNGKDRADLVKSYEALMKEKARLTGVAWTGNAEAEVPKLPTPQNISITRKQANPSQYKHDMEFANSDQTSLNPVHRITPAIVEANHAKPAIIDTNKKLPTSNFSSAGSKGARDALFAQGSAGETMFLDDHAEFTKETDRDKLRTFWADMPLLQKAQFIERKLSKEFDAKFLTLDRNALAETSAKNELHKLLGKNMVGGGLTMIFSGSSSKGLNAAYGQWDSADVYENLKNTLEISRPAPFMIKNQIDFAIKNAATPHARAEWEKLKDMLPLIESRNHSRTVMWEIMRDMRAKEAYIDIQIKPHVATVIAFEERTQALAKEVAELQAKEKAGAAKPVAVPAPTSDAPAPAAAVSAISLSPSLVDSLKGVTASALPFNLNSIITPAMTALANGGAAKQYVWN